MSQDVKSTKPDRIEQATTVCLLQTCRIPARHCRVAQVDVTGNAEEEMVIFCPAEEVTRSSGAAPAVCVIKIVLSIENHSLHPAILKQGELLGTLELVQEVTTVGTINAMDTDKEGQEPSVEPAKRVEQLLSELDIESTLGSQELSQLRIMVTEPFVCK